MVFGHPVSFASGRHCGLTASGQGPPSADLRCEAPWIPRRLPTLERMMEPCHTKGSPGRPRRGGTPHQRSSRLSGSSGSCVTSSGSSPSARRCRWLRAPAAPPSDARPSRRRRARRAAVLILIPVLVTLWVANHKVYGADKPWKAARRAGHDLRLDPLGDGLRMLHLRRRQPDLTQSIGATGWNPVATASIEPNAVQL